MDICPTVTILEQTFYCPTRIGVSRSKRAGPREREVNVKCWLEPVTGEHLKDTVDQRLIKKWVNDYLAATKFKTLEAAALAVARYCLLRFSIILVCEVTLTKHQVPVTTTSDLHKIKVTQRVERRKS